MVCVGVMTSVSSCTSFLVSWCINSSGLRQDGRHFADYIFKCIFLNEDIWILIDISLKFVPKGQINSIPKLVQKMAWHRSGDKPLSEPMMVSSLTQICITRPQWVNIRILMSPQFPYKTKNFSWYNLKTNDLIITKFCTYQDSTCDDACLIRYDNYIGGLVQGCSNSVAYTLELLQSDVNLLVSYSHLGWTIIQPTGIRTAYMSLITIDPYHKQFMIPQSKAFKNVCFLLKKWYTNQVILFQMSQ